MNEPTERKRPHLPDDQKEAVVQRQSGDKVPTSGLAPTR